ncbi:MAG: hypothetical protein JST30_16610 [Armatimonadetes bacterium]|nr:hypothetical protein [Armatimonadota bacterium]
MTVSALALAVAALGAPQVHDRGAAPSPAPAVPVLTSTEAGMFPREWTNHEIAAKAESLEAKEAERSLALVRQAMDAYPTGLLRREVRKVYVLKSLKFYGLDYGGTNSSDAVYLTNQGPELGYTDSYVRGSFHHEFSSILLRNHPTFLDQVSWKASVPNDFQYGSGGTEALRAGKASISEDPALAKRGFLTQYSTASQEEDFNMLAEGLFSGERRFWNLVDEHALLKAKVQVVVSFYAKLDPRFDEPFFRSLKP